MKPSIVIEIAYDGSPRQIMGDLGSGVICRATDVLGDVVSNGHSPFLQHIIREAVDSCN